MYRDWQEKKADKIGKRQATGLPRTSREDYSATESMEPDPAVTTMLMERKLQTLENSDKVGLSPNATAYDPSHAATKVQEKACSSSVPLEGTRPSKTQGATTSLFRPSSYVSSTLDSGGGATSTFSCGSGFSSFFKDSTIKEIAEKLSETAEAAASAAHTMDEQRRIAFADVERLARDSDKQLESFKLKVRELEEKVQNLSKEKDQLAKHRESAVQETHLWRSELAKAREHAVILEGDVVRAEEKVRISEGDAESRIKEAMEREAKAANEKPELHAYINILQEQLRRNLN